MPEDDTARRRLTFIRTVQGAGLALAEIRGILDLRDEGTVPCSRVEALLTTDLAEVKERKQHCLAALEGELNHLLQRGWNVDLADCDDGEVCPILSGRSLGQFHDGRHRARPRCRRGRDRQ